MTIITVTIVGNAIVLRHETRLIREDLHRIETGLRTGLRMQIAKNSVLIKEAKAEIREIKEDIGEIKEDVQLLKKRVRDSQAMRHHSETMRESTGIHLRKPLLTLHQYPL